MACNGAPQWMQKAFPEEGVRAPVGTLLDLFAPNLRTVLMIRMAAIATRTSPRKLKKGISHSPIRSPCHSSIGITGGTD